MNCEFVGSGRAPKGVNSTAMHRAAAKGHVYIVRALIAAGQKS